jgi:hypothetical protein
MLLKTFRVIGFVNFRLCYINSEHLRSIGYSYNLSWMMLYDFFTCDICFYCFTWLTFGVMYFAFTV